MSKTILVTGASDGIGFEIGRQAVVRGDKVMMVARDQARLERCADGMRGAEAAETCAVDLTDTQALDRFIANLDARGYVPDVLVNNAGQGLSGAFVDADAARIDEMLRLNILALTRLSHWAARRMKARRRGAIVNLSAAVATRPTPYFGAYAASKAYVTNLSQAMHSELKAHGVSVSAIHPPTVRTSFADPSKADLHSTLVLKLFPTVGPATVARASLKATDRGRRFVTVGPVAGIVLATAAIMPRRLDLAFMTRLSKASGSDAPPEQPGKRTTTMTGATNLVRSFYTKLKKGDAAGALGLMAPDIEWLTMWRYKVEGRGPERVAEDIFKPLMAEWSSFALDPSEFIADGDTVVSLGRFHAVNGATGKRTAAEYAHVWTVRNGKIARFRQYIDTLSIAEASRP